MQREVDRLHKKLRRRKRDRRSPSSPSNDDSGGSHDRSYQYRSRTPPSESYSVSSQQDKLEKGYNKHGKGPFHHTMGNDAMSKALRQISRSPFVRRINKARLLYRFSQPMFTIYNGGLIPWSMSVTLIRRWPSIPTTRPLCARCSLPTLGPSPCVGLMLRRRDQLGPLKN